MRAIARAHALSLSLSLPPLSECARIHTVGPKTDFLDSVLTTSSWLPETRNYLCFILLCHGRRYEFLNCALRLKRAALVL